MFSRRAAIGMMATGLSSLVTRGAFAADYPARPIRFLVGFIPRAVLPTSLPA